MAVASYPAAIDDADGLDDINRTWIYPEGFDSATLLVRDPAGVILPQGPIWLPLAHPPPLAYPAKGNITLSFVTRVPKRNGPFGFADGTVFLLGGWHPAFGDKSANTLPQVSLSFCVDVPADTVGFVGQTPIVRGGARRLCGRTRGRFLPLLLSQSLWVRAGPFGIIMAPDGRRRGRGGLRDISRGLDAEAHERLNDALRDVHTAIEGLGVDIKTSPPLVVVGPLREHLVEPFDGGVMVSDRAFHLLSWKRLLAFHRIALWRHVIGYWVSQTRSGHRETLPRPLVNDLVAIALRKEVVRRYHGQQTYVPELLEKVAVIPEIDALIFAPQVPFADAYYDAIDDSPAHRWHLEDFYHHRPRGRLLYEKLVDRFGQREVMKVVRAYLRADASFLEVADKIWHTNTRAYLAPWMDSLAHLDYALGEVSSTADEIGVEVSQAGETSVRELVTIEVVDARGRAHRATREGPGIVQIRAPGPAKSVHVDPDGRLIERLPAFVSSDPRFNNRRPHRWRFLLNNVTGLLAVTDEALTLSADFSLRRIHDLHQRLGFSALYGPNVAGVSAQTMHLFGSKITPLRLAQQVGLSLALGRLPPGKNSEPVGTEGSVTAFYGYDDRLSPYWAFSGKGLKASIRGARGSLAGANAPYHYVSAGLGGLVLLPLPAINQALVLRLRGDAIWGDAPFQSQLRLGDRYLGGRGYEQSDARGRRRLLGSAEYRHVLAANTRTDFWGWLTWTRLEGALFGDVIWLPIEATSGEARPSDTTSGDQACPQELFYDVGYGLRFVGDVLGISPAVLAVDVGIPLNRCASTSSKAPIAVYVAFVQSFARF